MEKIHIGLNLLHAHPRIGGGWNYIKSIVQSLQSYDKENNYTAYCTQFSTCLVKEQQNTEVITIGIDGTKRIKRILYENLFLPIKTESDNIDVLHWFANTRSIYCPTPSVITIHDLLAFQSPKSYPFLSRTYTRLMVPHSLHSAHIIAPVSETTKIDIHRRFQTSLERMIVVPHIIDDIFQPIESEKVLQFRNKYELPERYWLYVAHFYPHKNHERLFRAYALLRTKQNMTWPLVLCGMKNGADKIIAEKLREVGIEKNVIWLSHLDDIEMPILYSAASALVFPSLYEGGGIPIMEALACGCPVLASDLPTTREFAGNSTIVYFDGESTEEIAKAMILFANSELLHEYRMRGLEKAKTFRKEVIIPRLLDAYRIACKHRSMNSSLD